MKKQFVILCLFLFQRNNVPYNKSCLVLTFLPMEVKSQCHIIILDSHHVSIIIKRQSLNLGYSDYRSALYLSYDVLFLQDSNILALLNQNLAYASRYSVLCHILIVFLLVNTFCYSSTATRAMTCQSSLKP